MKTELKTLKDIEKKYGSEIEFTKYMKEKMIPISDLKQEAIKWVNKLSENKKYIDYKGTNEEAIAFFIKYFFDVVEDLK